jgi:hypothetical protein
MRTGRLQNVPSKRERGIAASNRFAKWNARPRKRDASRSKAAEWWKGVLGLTDADEDLEAAEQKRVRKSRWGIGESVSLEYRSRKLWSKAQPSAKRLLTHGNGR